MKNNIFLILTFFSINVSLTGQSEFTPIGATWILNNGSSDTNNIQNIENKLLVYPNPNSGLLTIDQKYNTITNIKVFSLDGEEVSHNDVSNRTI